MSEMFSIRFWYPAKIYYEDTLPGFKKRRRRIAAVCGEGHILYEDIGGARLLCGKEEKKLEKALDSVHIIRNDRINGEDICPACQNAWKTLPNSPWKKWVEGVSA